jgi:hypothetical protein
MRRRATWDGGSTGDVLDLPDSTLAVAVRRVVEPVLPRVLLHHSLRTFLYGRTWARRHGVSCDEDGLFAASLFHDLGLCEPYRDTRRAFQLNSSRALADLLDTLRVERSRRDRLVSAVTHHFQPLPRWREGPEAGLLHIGAYMDVAGLRRWSVRAAVPIIRHAYPPCGTSRTLFTLVGRSIRSPRSCLGIMLPDWCDDRR